MYDAVINSLYKDIFIVEKGSHNDTWAVEMGNYLRRLKDFMDRANTEMGLHAARPDPEDDEDDPSYQEHQKTKAKTNDQRTDL